MNGADARPSPQNRIHGVLLALVVLIAVAGSASGAYAPAEDNWPQWRGPGGNGVAVGGDPVIEWSESTNVAWKTPLPGLGSATPVIWGDRIYVLSAIPQGDDESEQSFAVFAIDRASGAVIWQREPRTEAPHEGKHQTNSFASGSAITDGEHVFAYFGSRGMYAYDLNGELLWDKDLGDMRTRLGFGEGTSPVLHGETLVVNWDHEGQSFIVALDKRTGAELWRADRDEPTSWATPLVVESGGRAQVVTGATNGVRSYDLESGDLLWDGAGLTANAIPSPVYGDGLLYVTSGYRGSALRAIRLEAATEAGTEAVVWEHNRDTPYVPSPLLYQGDLYFTKSNNPILTVLDAATGELRYGPVRLEGLRELYASPAAAGGRIYVVGRDGGGLVLAAGPEFKVLATNQLDDGFDASPVIVGDEIYLRGRRALYRLSLN